MQSGELYAALAQHGESLFKVPVFKADAEAAGDAGAGGLTGAVALDVIVHAQTDNGFTLAATERGADKRDLFKVIEVHYAPGGAGGNDGIPLLRAVIDDIVLTAAAAQREGVFIRGDDLGMKAVRERGLEHIGEVIGFYGVAEEYVPAPAAFKLRLEARDVFGVLFVVDYIAGGDKPVEFHWQTSTRRLSLKAMTAAWSSSFDAA